MRRLGLFAAVVFAVTLVRLLLAASGGGGVFTGAHPPYDASWTRSAANPILSPTETWEQTAVYEPNVIYDGTWKMWYGGGWADPGIGYATSTDGVSWTKYGSNPVLGQGGSGVPGMAVRNNVIKVGSTYYCYYADANPLANLKVATSSDGLAWTVQGTALAKNVVGWANGWANSTVWKEGSNWYMLAEGHSGSIWEIAYATSSDGIAWTLGNSGNQLTSLQVHAGGMYGGPDMHIINGTYHLWYHAAPGAGTTPTDIYHATSTDRINWTITPGTPVLTLLGTGFEIDQVADPNIVTFGVTSYLYYDGEDNGASAGHIGLATYP